MEDKKNVAKDYISSNNYLWPNLFNIKFDNSKHRMFYSYLNFCSFYLLPFCSTAIFSVFLYPKTVFFVKKLFKLKSFYSINLVSIY